MRSAPDGAQRPVALDDATDPGNLVKTGLKRWFFTPPRQHGEVDYSRRVSYLELFYDLVFVVLIGRAAHGLVGHISTQGVYEFAVVFGLIWLSWFNGTLWHELHGRQDGRSRLNVFAQMGFLAVLAVFTEEAAGADGPAFIRTLAALFVFLTWQWYRVQQADEDPHYLPRTRAYISGMLATVAVFIGSSFLESSDSRLWIWSAVVVLWTVGGFTLSSADQTAGFGDGVTESLVERFGLFTIIVLGEAVIGVVGGISDSPGRDAYTIAVGVVGLAISMGIWWTYFDLLGARVPSRTGPRLGAWMTIHLPMSMAIAATGPAITLLIEHADSGELPEGAATLLGACLAVVLLGIWCATLALPDTQFPPGVRRHIAPVLCGAAALTIGIGVWAPSALLIFLLMYVVLFAQWFWLVVIYLAHGGVLPGTVESASQP
ncbi:MAG: low temperature requirement protein A [Acidimicrobiia bacterium]|nr:low temperature requirement protein A [Acidimicrobiia bacterium]